MWDFQRGVCVHSMAGHSDDIQCLACDDGVAVTGSWDHALRCVRALCNICVVMCCRVWDTDKGKPLYTLRGHTEGHVISRPLLTAPVHGPFRNILRRDAQGPDREW